MKKKLLIALIAITAAICGAFGFAACGDKDGGNNGTYYLVDIDGSVKKNTYYKLDSGKWNNSDGESGSYETNGNKIIFYSEFMGEKEEWASAVLDNGVLTVTDGLSKDKFISENHKHAYGEWETVSELSCTVDGVKERKCSCGKIDKNVTKCVGYHTGDITVKEATCMEKGLITGYCTVCQKDINEEIDFADHKMGDWQMNEDSHFKACIVCGKIGDVEEHTGSGKCKVCEYPLVATEGLQFTLNDDKNSYTLTGIGNVTDKIIRIPDSYQGLPVTAIGETAFIKLYTVSVITNIIIPDSVTTIGEKAFGDCDSLTSVNIGNGVTSIGKNVFNNCRSLSEIKFKDIASYCQINGLGNIDKSKVYIGEQKLTEMTSIVILDSVTTIGEKAFQDCSSLTSITIPNSVTKVSSSVFYGCRSLISIIIPDSVTSIGWYAFYNCSSLTSVTIGNGVTNIGDSAFYGCSSLTSITIGNGVTSIGDSAFYGCSSLTIYCEAKSKPSGWNRGWYGGRPVVWNCKNNEVADDGYIYALIDGIRYSLKDGIATVVGQPSNITKANIPAKVTYKNTEYSVTRIGSIIYYDSGAFDGCTLLTSVTIPDSVTSIGSYAFNGCSSLTSITIPDSVTSIKQDAFYSDRSLTIYCEATSKPSGWNSNWKYSKCPVVWDCENNDIADDGYIYSIIGGIRYSLKDGTATVVRQPSNIEKANIPAKVTYKNIEYSVRSIDSYAFEDCDSLTSVTIGNGVTNIGDSAFYGCSSLTSITIGNGVTSIGDAAFSDCSSLSSVTMGNGVTRIGDYAFSGCSSLTSITFKGTKAQWKAIKKSDYWNRDTGNYTIHCTDGDIEK